MMFCAKMLEEELSHGGRIRCKKVGFADQIFSGRLSCYSGNIGTIFPE